MTASGNITKAAGALTLVGDTAINLAGDVSAVGLTFSDAVTGTGAVAQSFDAGGRHSLGEEYGYQDGGRQTDSRRSDRYKS